MYGKKVKLRFLFLVLILLTVILSVFLILQSLKENVVYFQSPSEIKSLVELDKNKIKNAMNRSVQCTPCLLILI